jgi:hypothetical protein
LYAQGAYVFRLLNVTIAGSTVRQGPAVVIDMDNPITAQITNTVVTSHTVGLQLPRNSKLDGDYAAFFAKTSAVRVGSTTLELPFTTVVRDDPQFVSPNYGDYRLANGSPLINQGDPARSYSGQTDVFGGRMPFGGRADIGAHEHVPINAQVFLPFWSTSAPYPSASDK